MLTVDTSHTKSSFRTWDGHEDQCLVCACLCSGLAIGASADCATSHRELGPPSRRVDGIEELRRRTACVRYPSAIPCRRLRSTIPILPMTNYSKGERSIDGSPSHTEQAPTPSATSRVTVMSHFPVFRPSGEFQLGSNVQYKHTTITSIFDLLKNTSSTMESTVLYLSGSSSSGGGLVGL